MLTNKLQLSKYNNYSDFINTNRYNLNIPIQTPYHKSIVLIPCDQTASSFPLKIMENILQTTVYPYYSNTHSNNFTGRLMSQFINDSKQVIFKCLNTKNQDKLVFTGSGGSGAINHLVHLIKPSLENSIVFLSIFEHYSNYLPWHHYAKEVVIIKNNDNGLIDLDDFHKQLKDAYILNKNIYVSISACSNVTGTLQNIDELARICHSYKGKFFVDFAANAPYVPINMHKNDDNGEYYDAIFISCHKLPGATSTPGLLVFNENIVSNPITYTPSGGTIRYLSKHSQPIYSNNLEVSQNGGTPDIIGIIKIGLAFYIKNHFLHQIYHHELKLTRYFQNKLVKLQKKYNHLQLLNPIDNLFRLPIFAIQIKPLHYNFVVALLCDLFGITTRGGISCSSIFAEHLLKLDYTDNLLLQKTITSNKGTPPQYGWIRITLHSIHSKKDINYIVDAIEFICKNGERYLNDYTYLPDKNIYISNIYKDTKSNELYSRIL